AGSSIVRSTNWLNHSPKASIQGSPLIFLFRFPAGPLPCPRPHARGRVLLSLAESGEVRLVAMFSSDADSRQGGTFVQELAGPTRGAAVRGPNRTQLAGHPGSHVTEWGAAVCCCELKNKPKHVLCYSNEQHAFFLPLPPFSAPAYSSWTIEVAFLG